MFRSQDLIINSIHSHFLLFIVSVVLILNSFVYNNLCYCNMHVYMYVHVHVL